MPLQKTLEQGVAQMGDVRNKDGASVPGLSDQRPQSGAFSVATGSIPAEAAETLCKAWEKQAAGINLYAEKEGKLGLFSQSSMHRVQADIHLRHADELRRLAGSQLNRQPESNATGEPRLSPNKMKNKPDTVAVGSSAGFGKYVILAWAIVNNETGRLMLIDVSYDSQEKRMESPAIYMTRDAARHHKGDDERIVRVFIREE